MQQAWIGISQQVGVKETNVSTVAVFAVKAVCAVFPVIIVWGWIRWFKNPKPELLAILSATSFVLTTLSVVLAICSVSYAYVAGGFPYHDPRLLKIFGGGIVLSGGGFCLALFGMWRPNSLRWHALACSLLTLGFWMIAATGE